MYTPPIVQHYNYLDLLRIDGEERLYETPDGDQVPSVTTILSATDSEEDKQGLANWRKFVGDAKADEICNEACTVGTFMHENLENRLIGKPDHQGSMPIRVLARRMADVIQAAAWPKITELWGQETKLYYPGLYAGTSDLVGLYNDKQAIMDYKNSRKPKSKAKIHNYFMQGCAYALAHNYLYGTDIKTVAVFICVREDPKNLQYQEFVIEGEEFEQFADMWIQRVHKFYEMKGVNS